MTSIEWLIEQMLIKGYFDKNVTFTNIDHLQHEAKEMHKQEIIDAFKSGLKSPYHQDYTFVTQENQEGTKSGQYYQETFKQPKKD